MLFASSAIGTLTYLPARAPVKSGVMTCVERHSPDGRGKKSRGFGAELSCVNGALCKVFVGVLGHLRYSGGFRTEAAAVEVAVMRTERARSARAKSATCLKSKINMMHEDEIDWEGGVTKFDAVPPGAQPTWRFYS